MVKSDATDAVSSCWGKETFESWDMAKAICNRIRKRTSDSRKTSSVYKCRHCSKWHIGTAEKKLKGVIK